MSQDAFPAELGWRWHMAPTECDGRDTVVSTCEGVVVHVLAGQMWPRDGSDAPPLSVYIAQGGGEDDPRRELRAVFYGRDGERHVLPRTHGRGGGWTGYRMFEMPPEVLPLVDVAFVGVEVRTAVERAAE